MLSDFFQTEIVSREKINCEMAISLEEVRQNRDEVKKSRDAMKEESDASKNQLTIANARIDSLTIGEY